MSDLVLRIVVVVVDVDVVDVDIVKGFNVIDFLLVKVDGFVGKDGGSLVIDELHGLQ